MEHQYNVIILIFDTLRSDYLSCYGGNSTTPSFRAAAEQGVVFESAFSTAPGTPVSHASLYSGQYPSEHGVTGQYMPLSEDVPVIAEWFQNEGYDTFGITGPAKMGSDWGYDRGFDVFFEPYYDLPPLISKESISNSIIDRNYRRFLIRQLTKGGTEKTRFKINLIKDRIRSELNQPFFVLCNFLTTHALYDPPRPYKEQATPEFSRPKWEIIELLLRKLQTSQSKQQIRESHGTLRGSHGRIDDPEIRFNRIMNIQTVDGAGRYLADSDYLNKKEVQLLRDWYTACVEYLDDEFMHFLDFYQEYLQENTILLLTADHGEQLGEHGLWEHSHYFFDETLKIPLIIMGPDIPEGSRRSDLVSHVDVFDTLCDICNLNSPPKTSGISLFSDKQRDAVFMEYGQRNIDDFANKSGHGRYLDQDQLRQFCAGRKAIRTQKYRYEITSNKTDHLFKLPEQKEMTNKPSDVTKRLRKRILETLGDEFGIWPEGDPDEMRINEQVQENLRKLGYIE